MALGFLFLGAGEALEKGFRLYKASKAAKAADEVVEVLDDVVKQSDEVVEALDNVPYEQLKNTPPCFLAGTLVKTPLGEVEIDKLTLENSVLVYDFKDKCIKEKKILKLYNNWTYRYLKITTNTNDCILATSKHLFWVEEQNKWLPAKELSLGMKLKSAENNSSEILSVDLIDNVNVPTYNLEVEDLHNYYVGQFGVLVHNQSKPSLFESTIKNNVEIYTVTDKATGKVVYVGQTVQGKDVRISQHAAEGGLKAEWDNPKKFDTKVVDSGNWTPYEAHVWEQHHLEKNGGKANLLNKKNPITKAKYDKFADLHNPCR